MSDGNIPPDPNEPPPGGPVPQPPDDMGLNLPPSTPAPAPPKKSLPWGMIIRVGIGILVVGGILFTQCGRTSAGSLDVGDCFEIPDGESFSSVKDQDCATAHEAEVYAEAVVNSTEWCFGRLIDLLGEDIASLPADFGVGTISDEDGSDARCVVSSASAQLVGSVLE